MNFHFNYVKTQFWKYREKNIERNFQRRMARNGGRPPKRTDEYVAMDAMDQRSQSHVEFGDSNSSRMGPVVLHPSQRGPPIHFPMQRIPSGFPVQSRSQVPFGYSSNPRFVRPLMAYPPQPRPVVFRQQMPVSMPVYRPMRTDSRGQASFDRRSRGLQSHSGRRGGFQSHSARRGGFQSRSGARRGSKRHYS